MKSGRKPDWKIRMDVPKLVLREFERKEKMWATAIEAKKRRQQRDSVPLARLESVEQQRLMTACVKRNWRVRKLMSPNVRGWPDLFVVDPVRKKCAFVELKVLGRSHPLSQVQADTLASLRACGLIAFCAWGANEALTKLEEHFND